MRIMITGGGTGGHTSPGVAILEELQRRDPRLSVQWVGRRGGIEERICQALPVPFRAVPVEGWPRKRSMRKALVAVRLAYSIGRCLLYLRAFRPQAVIGVGGYVSLPLMYAAQRMGVPTLLHEQNRLLGMANRILAPKAHRIFLSYADTIGNFPRERAIVSGNPVRSAFASPPPRDKALGEFGLDPALPVVLVSGGSQGARSVNQAVAEALPRFKKDAFQLLWMTGKSDLAMAREAAASAPVRTQAFQFIEKMAEAMAAADLIVTRSGASSTAEVAMVGRPSLLIPFPHATDNHQEENARAFEQAGAAELLLDRDLTGESLAAHIEKLLASPDRLDNMARAARGLARPGSAETIAEEILALVFEPTPRAS